MGALVFLTHTMTGASLHALGVGIQSAAEQKWCDEKPPRVSGHDTTHKPLRTYNFNLLYTRQDSKMWKEKKKFLCAQEKRQKKCMMKNVGVSGHDTIHKHGYFKKKSSFVSIEQVLL